MNAKRIHSALLFIIFVANAVSGTGPKIELNVAQRISEETGGKSRNNETSRTCEIIIRSGKSQQVCEKLRSHVSVTRIKLLRGEQQVNRVNISVQPPIRGAGEKKVVPACKCPGIYPSIYLTDGKSSDTIRIILNGGRDRRELRHNIRAMKTSDYIRYLKLLRKLKKSHKKKRQGFKIGVETEYESDNGENMDTGSGFSDGIIGDTDIGSGISDAVTGATDAASGFLESIAGLFEGLGGFDF